MEKQDSFVSSKRPSRSIFNQYLATLTGNFIVVCAGMHSAWPSPTLPQLLHENSKIQITSSEGSWIAVMPCLGAPLGAVFSALLVDKIGRKTCILTCSPLYLAAWCAIAYAKSLLPLIIGRFVVGIADGIVFTVFPMYVAEISHPSIRGLLGSSITVAFTFGSLIINCLGIYCSMQITAILGATLPVVHLLTFFWMPESPLYYFVQNKYIKADEASKKLTGSQFVPKELSTPPNTNGKSKLWCLFSEKCNRKALCISIGLRVVQQFSGNFVILFYCLMIFNEAGGAMSGSTATIVYFAIQIVSSTISTALVDKAGRRVLLIVSIVGSGIALATLGVYFYLKSEMHMDMTKIGFIPLAVLVLYNIMFNFGLSSIPTLVLSELFSTHIKGVALCVCDIFFALAVFLAGKFFQIFKDEFGMYVPFFAFALCCAAGLVFVAFCLPETKGKTLNEIQVALDT